ncbi:MAG: TetR/AcrR family transcriptional regulator [Clostridiales bacterium]|nr:TetR/AcrR family transcriptional regulator [Clostridiales bacterium]
MPTERFLNLPPEKQQTVLDAAKKELCDRNYDDLSINRIVKEAGISRGSFYEYFEDKDDLIEYIMRGYCSVMEGIYQNYFVEGKFDVFAVVPRIVSLAMDYCIREGEEALFKNLFSCLRMSRTYSFEWLFENERNIVKTGLSYVDRSKLKDPSDRTVTVLLDMVAVLTRNSMARIFSDHENREKHFADFLSALALIRNGACSTEQ